MESNQSSLRRRGLKEELLRGVAEHCVSDFISTQEEARKTLVNSIASNIYENLKNNQNISDLLTEMINPATQNKEAVLKTLMTNVSTSLEDALNRNKVGSDDQPPDSLDSERTSSLSSDSQNTSFEKKNDFADFDVTSDFVYESSCRTETRSFTVGVNDIPTTVGDISPVIPLTVEEISRSSTVFEKENMDKTEQNLDRDIKSGNDKETERKRRFSFSEEDRKVWSLPPRPSNSASNLYSGKYKANQASVRERAGHPLSTVEQLHRSQASHSYSVQNLGKDKVENRGKRTVPNAQSDTEENQQTVKTELADSSDSHKPEIWKNQQGVLNKNPPATNRENRRQDSIRENQQTSIRENLSANQAEGDQSEPASVIAGELSASCSVSDKLLTLVDKVGFYVEQETGAGGGGVGGPAPDIVNSLRSEIGCRASDKNLENNLKVGKSFTSASTTCTAVPANIDQHSSISAAVHTDECAANTSSLCQENHTGKVAEFFHQNAVGQIREYSEENCRSESRQSQRSLSPLSVGPVPNPVDACQVDQIGPVTNPVDAGQLDQVGPVPNPVDAGQLDQVGPVPNPIEAGQLDQIVPVPNLVDSDQINKGGPVPNPIDAGQLDQIVPVPNLVDSDQINIAAVPNPVETDKLDKVGSDHNLVEALQPDQVDSAGQHDQVASVSNPVNAGHLDQVLKPVESCQMDKVEESFEKLYQEQGQTSTTSSFVSYSEFSQNLTETMNNTSTLIRQENVHVVPITLVDTIQDDKDFIDIDRSKKSRDFAENCAKSVESIAEEKEPILGQTRQEAEAKTIQHDNCFLPETRELNKNRLKIEKDVTVLESKLPPLQDPSIILLSPTSTRRATADKAVTPLNKLSDDDYADLESLAEEVHHVKEDKARGYIHDKLKDSISDMIAYQKHEDEESKPKSHYEELKANQLRAQRDFHERLFQELSREAGESLKTSRNFSSTQSSKAYDQQLTGFSSVPSKSPTVSRRGSNAFGTWMSKSSFWSKSLPRERRRVKFADEPPERPPPPPPERQQSINTMKSLTQQPGSCNPSQQLGSDNPGQQQGSYNPGQQPGLCNSGQQLGSCNPGQKPGSCSQAQHPGSSNMFQYPISTNPGQQLESCSLDQQHSTQHNAMNSHETSMSKVTESTSMTSSHKVEIRSHSQNLVRDQSVNQSPLPNHESNHGVEYVRSDSDLTRFGGIQRKQRTGEPQESEYRVDLGEKKDRWMELYGNSVLNNTLHDRLENRLQRSQSAVWNKGYSNQDIIECPPVMSTDRLEKPKRLSEPNPTQPQVNTLPKDFSISKIYQPGLKRNVSMSDIPRANPPMHSDRDRHRQEIGDHRQHIQVPPSVVKSIVISVLERQGVPNPSDEIINKAIEEYYAKNPQGVFVGTGSEGVLEPGDKILSINNQPTTNISHVDANNLFRKSGTKATLEIARPGVAPPPSQTDSGMLSSPYSEQQKVHSQPYRTLPLVSPNPKTIHDVGEVERKYTGLVDTTDLAPAGRDSQDFVPLANQPYRTTPLILPNPKTMHDRGEAERSYCTSTLERQHKGKEIPYRTASLVMPGPKTINDVGVGAPMYQPYRGPQYNTQIQTKSYTSQPGQQYNSPRPLYSEESLNDTPAHPGFVQSNKLHLPSSKEATISKPHESETFKIVLESELSSAENQQGIVGKNFERNTGLDRPSSQLSDRSRGSHDAAIKNPTINQSTTFKKVMYSVLGESDY